MIDIERQKEMNRQRQKRYRERQKVTRNVTDNVTKSVTDKVTDDVTHNVTRNVTDNAFERKSLRNVTHNVTRNVTDNLNTVRPVVIEPKPAKNANPVVAKPVPKLEEPNFWDFAFRTDKQKAFEIAKKDKYKQKKKNARTWSDWVNALVGFGD